MKERVDVSIIIINYNTIRLTTDCINSVIAHTKGVNYEIILIENGTHQFNEENTQVWKNNNFKLIISDSNLGFSGANNLGIEYAKGDYILLLNSDTYLEEDAISKTVQFIRTDNKVGVVSARLVYPDGRHQSVAQRFPSIKYSLIELFRLQKLIPRKLAAHILLGSFFRHDETVEADWVWGAFFMFPKKLIAQLPEKKLDETYFMYWEDVQWCWDVKKLGYKIYFFADAQVIHIHEGSKANKMEMIEKNEALFFSRNYSRLHYKAIKLVNKCLGI